MDDPADEHPGVTFEAFRQSFYDGSHADMQFKFLAARPDDAAADALASVLDRLGEALDTRDLGPVRGAVHEAQVGSLLR